MNPLGDNLLPLLLLAIGGALFVGTTLAFIKPPPDLATGERTRPPVGRSLLMGGLGLVSALWAIASLVK